jgi:hypothetical protein
MGAGPPTVDPDTIDLDTFLNTSTSQASTPGQASSHSRVAMPDADRMAVVGIFVDDSGSMKGFEGAVIEGLNLSVEAFRGAKGSDFYLDVRGFMKEYFKGLLKDITTGTFKREVYYPDYESTPLISYGIDQLQKLREKARQYMELGIPTTVSQLLITDGFPNTESHVAEEYPDFIEQQDYIVGMGVSHNYSEDRAAAFRELFERMGIKVMVTPQSDPAEVRHGINQFSQSVASIASC